VVSFSGFHQCKEERMLDALYLLIGLAGFVLLWAVAKGCDRV
jgi:hypothetical protein